MGKFWAALGKGFLNVAVWCAGHPQVLQMAMTIAQDAAAAKK